MNPTPNSPPTRLWPWITAGILGALVVSQIISHRRPDDSQPVEKESARPNVSPRQLADAVYLRFLQDEASRSPDEKLRRAIDGIARARSLPSEVVREALDRFAAGVEVNASRNAYEAAVASAIRGRFEVLPATNAPVDPIGGPLRQISAHIAAKDWEKAESALASLRRQTDRTRDPEGYARVQAAAFSLRYAQDRLDDAFTLAREVRDIRERVLPPDSPGVARALENVAVCLVRSGRDAEAVPLYQRALAIYEKAYGPDDLDVADTSSELASALADCDRLAEAEAAARRAIPLFEHAGENQAVRLALTLDRLGYTLLLAKRNADAEHALRRAVQIYDRHPDARAKDHSDAVHRLALSIARQDGRRRESLPYFKRAAEIAAKWFTDDDPLFAVHFHNMAVWADGAGDDPLTVASYERALQILGKNQRRTKQEPAQLAQTKEFYAAYLKRAGHSETEIDRKVRDAMAR